MKPLRVTKWRTLNTSPPARGRGLKQDIRRDHYMAVIVAPRAGAWIETGIP